MSILECEMYGPVVGSGRFAGHIVAREVRIADWSLSTKRIDLVAVRGRWMYAVELKVSDWRRALGQAYANLYAADFSYVALWHEAVSRVDLDAFKPHGIGLLRVGRGGCETVLGPKRSPHVIPERRAYVRRLCLAEGGKEGRAA